MMFDFHFAFTSLTFFHHGTVYKIYFGTKYHLELDTSVYLYVQLSRLAPTSSCVVWLSKSFILSGIPLWTIHGLWYCIKGWTSKPDHTILLCPAHVHEGTCKLVHLYE